MINMKIKLNKWIGLMTGMFVLFISLNSCVKNRNVLGTDFSHLQDHVVLVNGGLVNFSAANIAFNNGDTTTVTLIVDLASVNLPTSPVKVTIGLDGPQVDNYNASKGTHFQLLPTNAYNIVTTTLTIPSGQQYAQTTVSFYKPALDPAVSYLLPFSITDASGKALTSNENTIFYNIIGNPIAGIYNEEWIRWNGTDTSGAPNYDFPGLANVFSAVTPTEVAVQSAGNGAIFDISFTNTGGVLSNFTVTVDPASYVTFGLAALSLAPVVQQADPVNGIYRFAFQYTNTSAAPRTVVEYFTR